jgi:polyisoprenoid-binding protein YceI
MVPRSRFLSSLPRRALSVATLGLLAATASAHAQTRWVVEPKASLAWWQVNPHLNHLWATTCPEEPSWRPGEGRSGGWTINPGLKEARGGYAVASDTTQIPLYPRPKVRAICSEGMTGELVIPDTVNWRGVRGKIIVQAEKLIGGDARRDAYARDAILDANRYREITFVIDSVVNVSRKADTVRGAVVGVFTLRNVSQPARATFRAWRDAGTGGQRVLAKFKVNADDLVPVWGLSKSALGLGVGVRIWQDLYMGTDMVLRPEGAPARN